MQILSLKFERYTTEGWEMIYRIPIYNQDIVKSRRVFDVEADETGRILGFYMQNIRGAVYVGEIEVERQIREYLEKR